MKYPLLDEVGNHFLDKGIEQLKKGNTFVIVIDNIDWMVKAHDMRSDKQNVSVHAVAASLVFDRVSSASLPTNGPQKTLKNCDVKEIISENADEKECTRYRYKMILARILCEFFPAFHFL
jgi:hypothetical protein